VSDDDQRCLVIDEHPVVRIGVRGVLGAGYEVEEAADLEGALDALNGTGGFDVAIVEVDSRRQDAGVPAGLALVRALRKAMPGTGIVAHARRPERMAASAAFDAGASAFVAKSSPPEALSDAVEAAVEATRYVDPAANGKGSALTRRQRQILQHLADGHSTTDIAHRLHLSAETVRTHTKAALARLQARDRAHAVAMALRSGLID
jgi:two-component system, NarL family, response regulator DesR